ncbi:MAG: hypothetical protein HYV07_16050, partial [Deltaproteobacteria bacterium]|nr:hypothetical protein [Deltaproteobacteria bacterium]
MGWLAGHLYRYTLDFVPGTISITIRDLTSGTTVAAFTVNDDRYTSGKFGFYNYSQPRVTYSGFSRAPLFTADCLYPSLAVDPDGDPVSYSLVSGPETMSI